MINKLFSVSLVSLSGIFGCASPTNQQSVRDIHPNIIVILTDDQGYGDFSITGNTNLHTPNIDRMAAEGTMFTNFYVCPVCAPTRAEFLTGRYHLRSGVINVSEGGERLNLDETTIADVFRAAGYATAVFGKWHSGMQYPYHPNGRGFDEFYGFCSGHWGDYFSPTLDHNGRIVQGEGFVPDDLTNKAISFIEENRDSPFFVYIPYNTPHSPMQVPDEWWEKFKDKEIIMRGTQAQREDLVHTRAALAMCENVDWNVGRVMDKLKESGIDGNTIVLYFNDNGPNGPRWNDGMMGIKGSTDEGGVRSPLFIRWPGEIPSGRKVSEISGAIDLLPTLADLAGISVETNHPLDGISVKPLIVGEQDKMDDRVIFAHWNGRVSARNQKYRFNHNNELYDVDNDPGQLWDISKENAELSIWYRKQVEEWTQEVSRNLSETKRPFTTGHPEFKFTQLPARDGTPHGGIIRSNQFPNSSFFTNWKSLSDKITWPIEVIEDGVFEVDIYYTCPHGSEGSDIKLSFKNNSLVAKITEPHDPPLIGMENDRVERRESYEKDFKPLRAGVIELKKGKGELTLEAISIPGSEVMDFRLLMLTRKK